MSKRRFLRLYLGAIGLLIVSGGFFSFYFLQHPSRPITADVTKSERMVQGGGLVTNQTGAPLANITVFLNGSGTRILDDGTYSFALFLPNDQAYIKAEFINEAGQRYQVADGYENTIWVTGDSVQQDFVIEPVP